MELPWRSPDLEDRAVSLAFLNNMPLVREPIV
jgi:hypothetical protein